MPDGEEAASAGFIEPTGIITQRSTINSTNLGERDVEKHKVLGPVLAERVKLHYDLGDVKWV